MIICFIYMLNIHIMNLYNIIIIFISIIQFLYYISPAKENCFANIIAYYIYKYSFTTVRDLSKYFDMRLHIIYPITVYIVIILNILK